MNLQRTADDYIDKTGFSPESASEAGSGAEAGLESFPAKDSARSVPDAVLLQGIARQDETDFSELYQRYSGMLYNFLGRLVGDASVAEDLLQEVFLAVWQGARRYRAAAAVKTWLFSITYKKAVSWLRRRRDLPLPEVNLPSRSESPEQVVQNRLQSQAVRQALDLLSVEQRAVVELAFFYDLPYAEIAEILGCPLGTVKSRMSYARRKLESYLQGEDRV